MRNVPLQALIDLFRYLTKESVSILHQKYALELTFSASSSRAKPKSQRVPLILHGAGKYKEGPLQPACP